MNGTPSTLLRHWVGLMACTLGALALSVCFFAPRLWLMQSYIPGTFQWDRAHTFLLQCEEPFRRDIEPAMLWRLLPPLVCHGLGLRGIAALVVPWLGGGFSVLYVARLHALRLAERRFIFGGTLLFATTSAVLVPVGWLGINDGWVWLGLLTVAFARSPWTVFAACILCPWIDERFIIGLPLAGATRLVDRENLTWRQVLACLAGLLPYIVIRLSFSTDPALSDPIQNFLKASIFQSATLVPWAPMAWWMGLRVGWVAVVFAVRGRPWLLGGGAAATLVVCMLLASDMSRSAAILCPLVLWGTFRFAEQYPALAPRVLLTAGIGNLIIPAAHVTYTKFDPINNLVIELLRLLRGT